MRQPLLERYDEDGEQLCMVARCDKLGRDFCPSCDAWVCNDCAFSGHDDECQAWLERMKAMEERDRRERAREAALDYALAVRKDER
jgi:uncharacterized C2H2 Zn-finger protein